MNQGLSPRLRLVAAGVAFVVFVLLGAPVAASETATPNEPRAAATPPAGTTMAGGSLRAMLALAPDILSGPNRPAGQVAMYADQTAQLAAVRVSVPKGLSDATGVARWTRATQWLTLPNFIVEHALMLEWRQTFGFDVFQIEQSLQIGEPPSLITVLRGRFSTGEVGRALSHSGYKVLREDGVTIYSLHADAALDLTSQVSQLALANMNNVAFLPDGTLVAASTLANVRAVISVSQGKAPSLAQRADIGALLDSMSTKLASVIIVPGDALRLDFASIVGPSAPGAAATAVARQMRDLGTLPPVSLGLIGVRPGGPLPAANGGTPAPAPAGGATAQDVIALVMATPGAARQAVPVIERRLATASSLATQRPYRDFFAQSSVRAVSGTPVVLVDLEPAPSTSPAIVVTMLFRRDLLFVAW